MAKAKTQAATLAALLEKPEEDRWEIVDGELTRKEAASGKHGSAQGATFQLLRAYRRRSGGPPSQPGGWWFASEALVELSPTDVRRPDIAGWRRERLSELPDRPPISVVPDWICEILSPTNASNDTVVKMRLYHSAQVRHYWLIDPMAETLSAFRWTPDGYLNVLSAKRDERVRVEPFEAVDFQIGVLFGDDEEP